MFQNKNTLKKNNSGFTIIEILVAVSLFFVISAGMTTMMTNTLRAASTSEARAEQIEMVRHLQLTLSDKPSCEKNFKNINLGSTAIDIPKILDRNGSTILEINQLVGNRNLIITEMQLQNQNIPSGGGIGDALLTIQTEKSKPVLGSKQSTNKITLKVNVDASGNIVDCFSSVDETLKTALQMSCLQLEGSFDEDTNQCNFNSDCNNISEDKPISGKCVKTLLSNSTSTSETTITEITEAAIKEATEAAIEAATKAATEAAVAAATKAVASTIANNTTINNSSSGITIANNSSNTSNTSNTSTGGTTIVNNGVTNVATVSGVNVSNGSINISSGSGNTQSNSITTTSGK